MQDLLNRLQGLRVLYAFSHTKQVLYRIEQLELAIHKLRAF